jgi:hypothetical protein
MQSSKRSPENQPSKPIEADRLDAAQGLVRWALGLSGLGLGVLIFGSALRSAAYPDTRVEWVEALATNPPALWSAGRTQRVQTSHPAVRTQFVPGLHRVVPSLAEQE